jgi:hypothetical protein
MAWFVSIDHAVKHSMKLGKASTKRQLAKKKKAERKDLKVRKEALKPKSKWLSEAQAIYNKYIRLRDFNDPCISCGKSKEEIEEAQGWKVGGCWDAGHFMTRGAKGQLRFILFNVHKQCKSCNGGSDKFSAKAATVGEKYRVNLIEKIGLEKVEFLENNNELDLKKGDIEYLKRIKKIFNKKFNLYKKRFRG